MTRTATAARSTALDVRPLHVAGRVAVVDAPGDGLTLDACVVPWHTAARVTDDGRTFYNETWAPGSLVPDDRVVIYDGHVPAGGGPGQLNSDRVPIGRASAFREQPDGLWATLTLANTARGRDVYELARTLGYVGVSLEAAVPDGGAGTVARTSSAPCPLTGIAVVLPPFNGAFPGAVAAARSDTPPTTPPPDDDDDDDDGTEPNPDIDPDVTPPAGAGRTAVAEIVRRELARYGNGITRQRDRQPTPFARYSDFDAVVAAARTVPRDAAVELSRAFTAAYHRHQEMTRAARTVVGRAWVDQVTADNPGLMPPSWLTEVFGIIDEGRPSITAMGGPRNPGDSGMDVYWPYYDGDLRAIVTRQAVEKTEINSVKVSFKRGQATLNTYAGGSDVSYQLQRRSTPSYMGLYDRILQLAYGIRTEIEFATMLAAVAGQPPLLTYDPATDTDGSALRAVLFAASARVKKATGRPATTVLAASDVFAALGGAAWLMPSVYGTQNISGTAQASTLRINVSGLEITEAPDLPDGEMIVTNDSAASWFEEGPFLVTAEDVNKLGTDVAIWGMGTGGVFTPAAIVPVTVTVPVAASAPAPTKKAAASSS